MASLKSIQPGLSSAALAATRIPARPLTPRLPLPMTKVEEQYIAAATNLPPLLLNFFRKHPPGSFSRDMPTPQPRDPNTPRPLPPLPTHTNRSNRASNQVSIRPAPAAALARVAGLAHAANPFLPFRNPDTNGWRPPAYSLRRQAELFKLGEQHNVLALLPEAPSAPGAQLQRRVEQGLRIKGTGRGQKVKGRTWERELGAKMEMRRKAMEDMPRLIQEWKLRGHGRGWKKWPSGRRNK